MSSNRTIRDVLIEARDGRRAAITARYPLPPKYANDNEPPPAQPACYAYTPPPGSMPASGTRRPKLTGRARFLQSQLRYPAVSRGRG